MAAGERKSIFEINDLNKKQKEETVLCEKKGEFTKNQAIFNEIAWMGTKNSSNDEWIEIKNISGNSIDLAVGRF